jgi:hypothetical protein
MWHWTEDEDEAEAGECPLRQSDYIHLSKVNEYILKKEQDNW